MKSTVFLFYSLTDVRAHAHATKTPAIHPRLTVGQEQLEEEKMLFLMVDNSEFSSTLRFWLASAANVVSVDRSTRRH